MGSEEKSREEKKRSKRKRQQRVILCVLCPLSPHYYKISKYAINNDAESVATSLQTSIEELGKANCEVKYEIIIV